LDIQALLQSAIRRNSAGLCILGVAIILVIIRISVAAYFDRLDAEFLIQFGVLYIFLSIAVFTGFIFLKPSYVTKVGIITVLIQYVVMLVLGVLHSRLAPSLSPCQILMMVAFAVETVLRRQDVNSPER
jgi:hypothetical protein